MPQGDKSTSTDKQQRQAGAIEKGNGPKGVGRPQGGARAWATVANRQGAGKKIGSGRKVPSGPVGGSGRKTNLARSS
ncbi:MAG TPA: hypothetical protein VFE82_04920 [Ramlibacter sp.]|jgi:hypothetical protein|uniref:hypothetical protein n=1 Tax=Ramlibacter sp. TaxID=1917967 RepID=UPI002D414E96|nr:hypothetical protein [Ramlibacter sp.]HZY17800.1 hypothetical protein [Ramlibacter sp.]